MNSPIEEQDRAEDGRDRENPESRETGIPSEATPAPSIHYADDESVMRTARRILEIHRETFRVLAQ